MDDALSERLRLLTHQHGADLEALLATHCAKLYVQMIELAALCLGMAMALALIIVIALRS